MAKKRKRKRAKPRSEYRELVDNLSNTFRQMWKVSPRRAPRVVAECCLDTIVAYRVERVWGDRAARFLDRVVRTDVNPRLVRAAKRLRAGRPEDRRL